MTTATAARWLRAAAPWAIAAALIGLHLIDPPAWRVNVRWADAASQHDIARLEHEFGLTGGELHEGRTWRYTLLDDSRENIGRIVTHPDVADTAYLDATNHTLTQELRFVPRRLRALKLTLVERPGRTSLLWGAFVFGLIGLVTAQGVRERPLFLILGISLLLRVVLVLSGGQFYWPDEVRFEEARTTVALLADGRLRDAMNQLAGPTVLFQAFALAPAAIERLTTQTPVVPGLFFSLFSVANIWLLKKIAERLGANETESLLAAALLAMSSSFFYFARHLVPYDLAMTFGLLALYAGASPAVRARDSLLCGALAAGAFLAYAGYWTFAVAAVVIHAGVASRWLDFVRRGVLAAAGFTAAVAITVATAALGGRFLERLLAHSSTITQGSYDEGWSLPWEFLWHAEHFMLVLWIASAIWAIRRVAGHVGTPRLRAGLLGAIAIYLMLVVTSTGLDVFVVYGRLARQLVPFFCLLTAAALERAFTAAAGPGRALPRVAALALLVQASINFLGPLRLIFPAEFIHEDAFDRRLGADVIRINVDHIYPAPERITLPGRYMTLREAPHPLEFRPYLYEGFAPSEREAMRAADITMRLVRPLAD